MPKKSKKSLSKRQSLKDKFKIIRKVKEHNRKLRRNAKKAGKKRKPSLLKDPGIPNHFPYRDEVVKELQFEKVRIAAKRLAQKEARRARQLERNVRYSQNLFVHAQCQSVTQADPFTVRANNRLLGRRGSN
jgi:nuclear GTP-binding protein